MKKTFLFALLFASNAAIAAPPSSVTVSLMNAKGEKIGEAKISQLVSGVRIQLDAKNLPPGDHALHFHDKGACKAPDFKSAGDHFAPTSKTHGFDVAGGPHAGDMPNLVVAKDGTVKAEVINAHVTLGDGANSLLKKEGTALVIHASADDYKTQPSGGAGDRIVCGEIKAP